MAKKPVTKESALLRLASLCSRSEQCEFDINRKMLNWGLNSSQRQELLEYLKENKYLDESRFARSFTNDKARFSAWGPYKIRLELRRRRINNNLITEAISNVEQEIWKEGLLKNLNSKAKNLDLTGEEAKENMHKLYQALIRKGFPSQASSKAVALIKKRQERLNESLD